MNSEENKKIRKHFRTKRKKGKKRRIFTTTTKQKFRLLR